MVVESRVIRVLCADFLRGMVSFRQSILKAFKGEVMLGNIHDKVIELLKEVRDKLAELINVMKGRS